MVSNILAFYMHTRFGNVIFTNYSSDNIRIDRKTKIILNVLVKILDNSQPLFFLIDSLVTYVFYVLTTNDFMIIRRLTKFKNVKN